MNPETTATAAIPEPPVTTVALGYPANTEDHPNTMSDEQLSTFRTFVRREATLHRGNHAVNWAVMAPTGGSTSQIGNPCYGPLRGRAQRPIGLALFIPKLVNLTTTPEEYRTFYETLLNPETSPVPEIAQFQEAIWAEDGSLLAVILKNTNVPMTNLVNYWIMLRVPYRATEGFRTYTEMTRLGIEPKVAMFLTAYVSFQGKNSWARTSRHYDWFVYGGTKYALKHRIREFYNGRKRPIQGQTLRHGTNPGIPNNQVWGATNSNGRSDLVKNDFVLSLDPHKSHRSTVSTPFGNTTVATGNVTDEVILMMARRFVAIANNADLPEETY